MKLSKEIKGVYVSGLIISVVVLMAIPHIIGHKKGVIKDQSTIANELVYPVPTLAYYQAKKRLEGRLVPHNSLMGYLSRMVQLPRNWSTSPSYSFYYTPTDQERSKIQMRIGSTQRTEMAIRVHALKAESEAKRFEFQRMGLNRDMGIRLIQWRTIKSNYDDLVNKTNRVTYNLFLSLFFFGSVCSLGLGACFVSCEVSLKKAAQGVATLFVLSVLVGFLSANKFSLDMNISFAFWAVLIGLFISQMPSVLAIIRPVAQVPFYFRVALILYSLQVIGNPLFQLTHPALVVMVPVCLVLVDYVLRKVWQVQPRRLYSLLPLDIPVLVFGITIVVAIATHLFSATAYDAVVDLNRLQHILFVVIAFGISCFWKIAVEDEGRGRHLSHTQPFLLSAVLGVIVVTLIWLLAGKSVYQVVINQFMVDSVFQPVTQWFLTFGLLSAVAMIPYNKMRKRIPAHLTPVNYIAIHAISFVAMVSVMVALYFQVTI